MGYSLGCQTLPGKESQIGCQVRETPVELLMAISGSVGGNEIEGGNLEFKKKFKIHYH